MNTHLVRLILPLLAVVCIVLPCAAKDKTTATKVDEIEMHIPNSWKKEKPSNRLRAAQYSITPAEGDEEPGEFTVFSFGASGLQANVDRWIGKFSSKDRVIKKTKGKCELGEYFIVDITGTYNKPVGPPVLGRTAPMPGARVINVMLNTKEHGTYFVKFVAEEATTKAQADAVRGTFGGETQKEEEFE